MLVHPSARNFRGRRMQYLLIWMIARGGLSVLRAMLRIVERAPGVCVRQFRTVAVCVRQLRAAGVWNAPSITNDGQQKRF